MVKMRGGTHLVKQAILIRFPIFHITEVNKECGVDIFPPRRL